MISKIKKNTGFSIVEVIVAAVIFTLASLGTFGAFSMARQTSSSSEQEIIAANYGRQILEDLRAQIDQGSWASWYLTCPATGADWPSSPTVDDAFQGTVVYKCTVDATGAKKVTVTMTW